MKLQWPKFETHSGNEQMPSLHEVKQIYKDFFRFKSKTQKDVIELLKHSRAIASQNLMMYAFITVVYALYWTNSAFAIWLNSILPSANNILLIIGGLCITQLTVSYIDEIRSHNRSLRLLTLWGKDYCDSEDRL